MKRNLLATFGALFLVACAQDTLTIPAIPKAAEVKYVPGELNHESVFQLLSAEFANLQQQYPYALNIYMNQAALTKDAAIAERATHIAQYLGEMEKALRSANYWIEAAPTNPEPYQIAISILIHQKDFSRALPLLEDALNNSQTKILATLDTQGSKIPKDILAGYVQLLERQLIKKPNSSDLLRTYGVMLRYQGKHNAASKALTSAHKHAPSDTSVTVQLADFLRSQKKSNQSLSLVKKALIKNPNNRALKLLSIQLNFDLKRHSIASKQALEIIESQPEDQQLHLYLAMLLLDANQLDKSEKVLTNLLDIYPETSTPNFYLGIIAQRRSQPELAIKYFLNVNSGKQVLPALSRTAALLDSSNDESRLSEILSRSRLMFPQLSEQLYILQAQWLNSYSSNDLALALLEDAIYEHPHNAEILYTRAMLLDKDDFALAEKDLRTVIQLQPNNAQALNALGYTLTIYSNRFDEALTLLKKAYSLRPNDPAILDSLGWVKFKLKEYKQSLSYLQRAYQRLPAPEVVSHLCQALVMTGATTQATKLLRKYLSEHPNDPYLLDAAKKVGLTP